MTSQASHSGGLSHHSFLKSPNRPTHGPPTPISRVIEQRRSDPQALLTYPRVPPAEIHRGALKNWPYKTHRTLNSVLNLGVARAPGTHLKGRPTSKAISCLALPKRVRDHPDTPQLPPALAKIQSCRGHHPSPSQTCSQITKQTVMDLPGRPTERPGQRTGELSWGCQGRQPECLTKEAQAGGDDPQSQEQCLG